MSPQQSLTTPYRTLAVLSLGAGAFLLILSACGVLAFFAVPQLVKTNALRTNTFLFSATGLALAYGAVLVEVGRGLRRQWHSPPLRLPSPLIFIAAFVVVLAAGQAVLTFNLAPAYLFPLWHALAALLMPLAVVAFAVRRLPPVSARAMLAQFSWGGLVTISIALVLELVIVLVLGVLAILAIAVLVGADRLQALATALQGAQNDPEQVLQLLLGEWPILAVLAFTGIVLFVFVVPLVEEMLKGGGPAILMARRRSAGSGLTPAQVVMWGLAAGAGYAFTENVLNTQTAVSSGGGISGAWAGAMLLRAGTTLMHMIATATVAVAWYQILVNKRKARGLLLVAGALAAHAVWNSGALLFGAASAASAGNATVGAFLGGIVLVLLGALFVGFLVWLMRLIRWAQPPSLEIITASGDRLEIKG